MPVNCSRCGAVNPDGNTFCATCGQPIAAAAPGVPGAAGPPPAPVPGSTFPPSGTFAGGAGTGGPPPGGFGGVPAAPPPLPATAPAARASRLSRNAIIAIAVVALLLIAGAVVVFAAISHGKSPSPGPTSAPHAVTPRPQPVQTTPPTPNPTQSALPSPTSGSTTSPNPSPSASGFASYTVPSGASIAQQSDSSVEIDSTSSNAQVFIAVDQPPPSGVTDSNSFLSAILQNAQGHQDRSNVNWCPNGGPPTPGTVQGDTGQIQVLDGLICGTQTPSSGPAFQFTEEVAGAYVTGAKGPETIFVEYWAPQDIYTANQQSLEAPFLQSLVWHGVH